MSYEGPHIIDLGTSHAEAESEAQLVEQNFAPAVPRPRVVRVARSHLRPRSTHQLISGPRQPRCGLNFVGPTVLGSGPVRPVTLRRHLSMVLPLSKIASRVN